MYRHKKHTGFAIALAWPETWCKQPGSWYDGFVNRLGISKHHFYKVGHAALVLVDDENSQCHYFDFGRYHTPFQHGRARSENTDDGLQVKTKAKISTDKKQILNFGEILTELQQNSECHGEGAIHASYGRIHFENALAKAEEIQRQSPVKYGPFSYGGSNCSRFVNTVIRAGKPGLKATFKLNFGVPLTPTPLNNVDAFSHKTVMHQMLPFAGFQPQPLADKSFLKETLREPGKPAGIPENAQWLAGEGAGSWFSITPVDGGKFEIARFSPEGKVECAGIFAVTGNHSFNIENPYRIDYLSHCHKVALQQNQNNLELIRIDK